MLVAGAVNLSPCCWSPRPTCRAATTPTPSRARTPPCATPSGPTVALFFAIGLLASGLASTSVGAYAGAMIMQGLLRRSYPLLVRRLVTLIPALVILAIGVDPSRALVFSQVVLSFGIPFALIPLVRLTSNRALMGDDTNHRVTTGARLARRRVDQSAECGADLSDRDAADGCERSGYAASGTMYP